MPTAKKRKKTTAATSAAKKSTTTRGRSATSKTAARKAKPSTTRTLKKTTASQKAPAKTAKGSKAMTKKAKKKTSTKAAAKKTKTAAAKKKTSTKAAAKKTKTAAAKKKTSTKAAAKKTKTADAKKRKTSTKAAAKKTKTAAAKKKTSTKATAKKKTSTKATAKKTAKKAAKKTAASAFTDAALFGPLSEGERADAVRVLTEDSRLENMARVGRYRVIAVEPLAVKPPHDLSSRRLARVVIYDYSTDRSVDACIDLDASRVAHLKISHAQPMLAREEEAAAISIALSDEQVKEQLSLGEEPQVAMHYWSAKDTSISYSRRSAAVIFGRPDGGPSLIAVVDLLDSMVCEIVPATQW